MKALEYITSLPDPFTDHGYKPSTTKVLYSWSQVLPDDMLSIRAIVEGDSECPCAYVDNHEMEMVERALPDGESFPEKICQLPVPRKVQDISINGQKIPALKETISKIAIIGDTGCIPPGKGERICNDETWPLKENLQSISTHKPDLIIHLGDYNYKISECSFDRSKSKCLECAKNADKFQSWQEEWLDPSTEVLQEIPALFIRGNHENCDACSLQTDNGGTYKAWHRYFDTGTSVEESRAGTKSDYSSWIFDAGPLQFYILDSSYCDNDGRTTDPERVEQYKNQFTFFNEHSSPDKPNWLVTHKQFWSLSDIPERHKGVNENLLPAFKENPIESTSAILSGHTHIAQIILMNNAPTQVISGHGGGLLHSQNVDPVVYNAKFNTLDGAEYNAKEVLSFSGFGFAILDLEDHKFSFYNKDNEEIYSADLTENFSFF